MFDEFVFWLLGIEEDDPLPYEITCVYFCINKGEYVSYGASEQPSELAFNFDYFPLEAQYFYSPLFTKTNLQRLLRELVENALCNDKIKNLLSGKRVFVANFGEKPFFEF